MHNLDAGHRFGGFRVQRDEGRIEGRRANNLPIKHAFAFEVRGVLVLSSNKVFGVNFRDRCARDGPILRLYRNNVVRDDLNQLPTFRYFG